MVYTTQLKQHVEYISQCTCAEKNVMSAEKSHPLDR